MKGKEFFVHVASTLCFFSILIPVLGLGLTFSSFHECMTYLLFFVAVLIPFVHSRNRAQSMKGSHFVALTDVSLVFMIGVGLLFTSFSMEGAQFIQVLGNTDSKVSLLLVEVLAITCVNAW